MSKTTRLGHYGFFAYGPEANADCVQRLGLQVFQWGRARLLDQLLVFTNPSPRHPQEGWPDLIATSGSIVEGVLYEVDDAGVSILDKHYLVRQRVYSRKTMPVLSDAGDVVTAIVYVGCRSLSGLRPSPEAKAELIEGASARGFSEEYVTWLRTL